MICSALSETKSRQTPEPQPLNFQMKSKRIVLVIPSLQAGGMERVMAELATHFATKPWLEIHLVLYGIVREIFYPVPPDIKIHKPSFVFSNRLRFINSLRTLWYLRSKLKELKPDSVLSFGEYWNSFVLLAATGLHYPVYISDRCSPEKRFSSYHTMLRKALYPGAAGIIAQTSRARDIYLRQGLNRNIEIIGNPIREIPADHNTQREKSVLMVGRLIKTKHQDKLIELFCDIDDPEWKLVLIGYDHLQQRNYDRLQLLVRERGAEDKVILAGKISDVDSYYRRSRIFAFTSSSEGFPNVIGEAMSAGLAVVAFDCVAGPSEMIRDGSNGFLIPLFDYEMFRERLKQLMSDDEMTDRFGGRGKEDIKRFSPDVIGEMFLDFIKAN